MVASENCLFLLAAVLPFDPCDFEGGGTGICYFMILFRINMTEHASKCLLLADILKMFL